MTKFSVQIVSGDVEIESGIRKSSKHGSVGSNASNSDGSGVNSAWLQVELLEGGFHGLLIVPGQSDVRLELREDVG